MLRDLIVRPVDRDKEGENLLLAEIRSTCLEAFSFIGSQLFTLAEEYGQLYSDCMGVVRQGAVVWLMQQLFASMTRFTFNCSIKLFLIVNHFLTHLSDPTIILITK